jgi:transcriptional regulator GlxA family with amidase domain
MVTCAKGLRVEAQYSVEDSPSIDILIYPGGLGTRPLMDNELHLHWLRQQRKKSAVMASVCAGALVFAAAGLMRGHAATTHWRFLGALAELDPTIDVRRDDRFVDDGDIVSSAGISAGIDMALHLVERLSTRERALSVQRDIQYEPRTFK